MRKLSVAITLFACLISVECFASVTDTEAVTVILGAASDESYKEMYAIACALKNSDTTEGVFERVADISNLPQELKDEALRAWTDAKTGLDVTLGATEWENEDINGGYMNRPGPDNLTSAFQHARMQKTVTTKIGRHTFRK